MPVRAAPTAGQDTLPRQARELRPFHGGRVRPRADARVAGIVRDRLDRERGGGPVLYEHALRGWVAITPWAAHTPRRTP
ncbi:hypothetical protein [Streptomyces sp. NBC_00063]|uniref:hypothetical protein n=1 Tax=Streptomyces sp. NBC_00063 TaxID=2975638 RepID=UPI003D75C872